MKFKVAKLLCLNVWLIFCLMFTLAILNSGKIMWIFLKFVYIGGLIAMLSACSLFQQQQSAERLCADDNGEFYPCIDMPLTAKAAPADPAMFKPSIHFKALNDYTQQMAMDLKKDLQNIHMKGPIAVASFVYHDKTLRQTNQVGNDISEFFINDLQKLGIPVSEHNLAEYFERTDKGDFVLSRQQTEILENSDAAYVLTGTMMKVGHGLMINARIIDLDNKHIVATSSKVLPPLLTQGMY